MHIYTFRHTVVTMVVLCAFWNLNAYASAARNISWENQSSMAIAGIPGNWKYVGGDEFNQDAFDLSKWNIGHWYEHTDLNVVTHTVSGGYLRLCPKIGSNGKLIARTLTTDGKFYLPNDRTYYVEFKAQLPMGSGRWPALWLFNHDDAAAPSRPELDVMETGTSPPWGDGKKPVAIKATSWTDEGMNSTIGKPVHQQGQHSQPKKVADLTATDHIFGALVSPQTESVTYYVDGEIFAQHHLNSTRVRLYLVISDQYDGAFNQKTPADQLATVNAGVCFAIDYVRVFTRN